MMNNILPVPISYIKHKERELGRKAAEFSAVIASIQDSYSQCLDDKNELFTGPHGLNRTHQLLDSVDNIIKICKAVRDTVDSSMNTSALIGNRMGEIVKKGYDQEEKDTAQEAT